MSQRRPPGQGHAGRSGRPVTIRDVARLAKVSVGTVSRGLNNPEKLAPETRAAVEGAIKTLGYRVNALARSIRTRTTGAVALLVHDIRNPVFAAVAQAAQGRLNRSGYLVVVAGSDPAVASDAQIIHALTERRIDGLIAFLRREDDAAVVAALDGFGGPIVLVDREMSIATDVVLSDHAGGVAAATEALFDHGHRRVALITGVHHILPGRERVAGFRRAHLDRGLVPREDLIRVGNLGADYGYRETFSLLGTAEPPTAIVAGGNQLLEGVLRALRVMAIDVPAGVSVVGFDDTPLAATLRPGITVVRRDTALMGTTAAELLLDRLQGGERDRPPRRIMLPTEIVFRDSIAAPPDASRNE